MTTVYSFGTSRSLTVGTPHECQYPATTRLGSAEPAEAGGGRGGSTTAVLLQAVKPTHNPAAARPRTHRSPGVTQISGAQR